MRRTNGHNGLMRNGNRNALPNQPTATPITGVLKDQMDLLFAK